MKTNKGDFMKKGDLILISSILIVAVAVFLYFQVNNKSDYENIYVEIKVDGKEYKKIELSEDYTEEIKIDNEYGYNLIYIDGYSVSILEADCPDHDCIEIGKITPNSPLKVIVCAPHHLTVKLLSGDRPLDDISS